MQTNKCDICSFETDNKKIFANHVRWKHKEKHFSEEGLAKIRQIKVFKIQKSCLCYRCNKKFVKELYEREWKKIQIEQNNRVYCSIKCANSRQHTEEEKEKITKSLKYFYKDKTKPLKQNICKICEKIFNHKLSRKTCSKECYLQLRKRKSNDIRAYRNECKFSFSLNDYPEEFNFELVKIHGWYKAKNRGDNQNGVSRDHMVSVKFGYVNKIDPNIIKHPANCKLILQKENFNKKESCSLSLEELMIRIEEWDKKYGARGC